VAETVTSTHSRPSLSNDGRDSLRLPTEDGQAKLAWKVGYMTSWHTCQNIVLTITQPPYFHNLISIQRPRSTLSSSVVTLARPPSLLSLKLTDHSFRYASPCLWNQLPLSIRKPHSDTIFSISNSHISSPIISTSYDSSPCLSITFSLCHFRLKTYLFHKSFPRTPFADYHPDRFSDQLGFWF